MARLMPKKRPSSRELPMRRAKKMPPKVRVKPLATTNTAVKKTAPLRPHSVPPNVQPDLASSYTTGDAVSHPLFGHGVVMEIDGDRLTIKFADGRVKQIRDDYVKHRR